MPFRYPTSKTEQRTVMLLGLSLIPLAMLISRSAKDVCAQGQVVWEATMLSVQERVMVVQVVCMPKAGPFVLRFAELPPGPFADIPETTKPEEPYQAPDASMDPDFGWYYVDERFQSSQSAIEAARAGVWDQ